VGPVGMLAHHQGDDAGDVWRRHRRAAVVTVGAVGRGKAVRRRAEDIDAWGGDVDGGGAVVGESRQLVVPVSGRHRDDVVEVVAGRIAGGGVVVDAIAKVIAVAGRGHENVAVGPGVADRVIQGGAVAAAAPTVV